MKTITITLYNFDELNEDVKEEALESSFETVAEQYDPGDDLEMDNTEFMEWVEERLVSDTSYWFHEDGSFYGKDS